MRVILVNKYSVLFGYDNPSDNCACEIMLSCSGAKKTPCRLEPFPGLPTLLEIQPDTTEVTCDLSRVRLGKALLG